MCAGGRPEGAELSPNGRSVPGTFGLGQLAGQEERTGRYGVRMQTSAGLLMYRGAGDRLEVLLVHPGGPFFANKDDGSWSVPKGLVDDGEDELAAAQREFREETGFALEAERFLELGDVRLKSGKRVVAWACAGDCDPDELASNSFELEWPPRSGRTRSFPEVDRAAWFDLSTANAKINECQAPFLQRLVQALEQHR